MYIHHPYHHSITLARDIMFQTWSVWTGVSKLRPKPIYIYLYIYMYMFLYILSAPIESA